MRLLQKNKFHKWLDKETTLQQKKTEGYRRVLLKLWVEAAGSIKLVRM